MGTDSFATLKFSPQDGNPVYSIVRIYNWVRLGNMGFPVV